MRRRRREHAGAEAVQSAAAERPTVEEQAAAAKLSRALHAEIERLEDRFLAPLLKRYFEGMSYREIGAALQCSTGTVSSRLSRAVARLRAALASRGLLEGDEGGNDDE